MKTTKGPRPRATLSHSLVCRLLRRIGDPHDRQPFCLSLLPEVQRHAIAAEEHNPRRGKLVVQHLVVALEGCRPPMGGPARIEPGLRDPARARPPGRDHLGPVLATLVTEEDLLVAVLLDPLANLVERVEDDVDIGPVGRARDDQRNPLDFRFRSGLTVVLLQELPGLEDGSGLLRPRAGARACCRGEGMAGL